jgi:PAS domain S-box-containing protein
MEPQLHAQVDLSDPAWQDLLPDVVAVLDLDGTVRTAIPGLERGLDDWLHPDDLATLPAMIDRALDQPGAAIPFAVRHRPRPVHPSIPVGSDDWVPAIASITDGVDNPRVGGLIVRLRPTRAADAPTPPGSPGAESTPWDLFDCADVGVMVCDRADRITYVNGSFATLLGSAPTTVLGRTLTELLAGDAGRSAEAGDPAAGLRAFRVAGGAIRWLAVASTPHPSGGTVLLAADATDLRRTVEASQVSEALQRSIADNVPVGVFVLDGSGVCEYVNPRFVDVLDCDLTDVRAGSWLGRVHPEDEAAVEEACRVAWESGQPLDVRYRISTLLGDVRWVQTCTQPVVGPDGSVVNTVGIVSDISATVEIEEHLAEAFEQAIEASRMKSEFLANMSHEIRTPLNGVIGMASLLLNTPLNRDQFERVVTLRSAGEHLLSLINDILDFSKAESGRMELEQVEFELLPLVHDVGSLYSSPAFDKGVRLRIDADTTIPRWVCGDPARVRQVLTNLVSNAIKFTESGSVTIRVTSEGKNSTAVRFEVVDTGIGIELEAQSRIFAAFTQADASMTRRYGGTGLGLAICKQLVELMGGVLSLTSAPGRGSTFFFTIPFAEPADQVVLTEPSPAAFGSTTTDDATSTAPGQPGPSGSDDAADAAATPPAGRPPLPGKVLLVEDNAINQKVALGFLKHLGIEADVANDGLEGFEAAMRGNYRLIIMDCQMPRMDGFEATQRIRSHERGRRRTPIIALTANAMQGDRERCIEAGMDDYVSKPIDVGRLSAVLEKWFAATHDDAGLDDVAVYDPRIVEQLKELPGSDGAASLFDEVGALFRTRSTTRVDSIVRLLDQGLWLDAAEEAHALKGMASSIGANRLAGVAAEVQNVCRAGAPQDDDATRLAAVLQAELALAQERYPGDG